MSGRETCAACGQPRATDADLAELAPACRTHRACSACEDVPVCWYADEDACAEERGGWAAVARGLRLERDEAWATAVSDDELTDVVKLAIGLGVSVKAADEIATAVYEGADIAAAIRAARGQS